MKRNHTKYFSVHNGSKLEFNNRKIAGIPPNVWRVKT